jgi:long-chain fatty acid transport protein
VRASLPLDVDLPFVSQLELPATATLGLGFGLGRTGQVLLEVDATWTGWSSVQEVAFVLPANPLFSSGVEQDFEDVYRYAVGLAVPLESGWEWRFGYAFDPTPQPERTVGPFFVDADRHTLSFGLGRDWLNVGVAYQRWDERTNVENPSGVNGRYRNDYWLLALTVGR